MTGKIYLISSKNTDKVYVGATTHKYLSRRFAVHKNYMKLGRYRSSHEVLKFGDCTIDLLCEIENPTKKCLSKLERYFQNEYRKENLLVNKNVAGRTAKEYYREVSKKKLS